MPLVVADALGGLPIPPVRIQVNNRKVCEGFYRGLGLSDPDAALRAVDKLDKIGPARVAALLAQTAGATEAQAKACLALAEISAEDASFADAVRALGVKDPLLDEGLEELVRVVEAAPEHAPGLLVADLRIARGLDYYTGTVYETVLRGYEGLLGVFRRPLRQPRHLRCRPVPRRGHLDRGHPPARPAVRQGRARISRKVPTACSWPCRTRRSGRCDRIAATLRGRGIATEVSPTAAKYGKQIRYAERRGIPFVWFPGVGGPTR